MGLLGIKAHWACLVKFSYLFVFLFSFFSNKFVFLFNMVTINVLKS